MVNKSKQWKDFGVFLLITFTTTATIFTFFFARRSYVHFALLFLATLVVLGAAGQALRHYNGKNKSLKKIQEVVDGIFELVVSFLPAL